MPRRLILASASPRRRELLSLLGIPFEVMPGEVDEDDFDPAMNPPVLAGKLAVEKANHILQRLQDADLLVLGADTIVVAQSGAETAILNKPQDASDARRMLSLLSGATHTVYTGVALVGRSAEGTSLPEIAEVVGTQVTFRELNAALMDAYIATGEPFDKAGAYGIQERAAPFVEAIHGDYFNVVGLPVKTVARMLERLGVEWWRGAEAFR
jgi:septum formation protein